MKGPKCLLTQLLPACRDDSKPISNLLFTRQVLKEIVLQQAVGKKKKEKNTGQNKCPKLLSFSLLFKYVQS